ncbi:MAG: chromate transporter [Candidatus Omnitrophota bacterium]
MILWQLFLVFFRIGFFAVGGAYSFLPLIQKDVVERYAWLTQQEFLEVLGIVKVFPGAISIKFATYVGQKMAGVWGAVVANIANLLAPVVLILIATYFYHAYKEVFQIKNAFAMIQFAVFAMIIAVAFQAVKVTDLIVIKNLFVVLTSFVLFFVFHVHPVFILLGAGLIGAFLG